MPFYVYKLINSKNDTIYIGQTDSLQRRLNHHFKNKMWSEEICKVEFAELKTREAMDLTERIFIKKESPKYNDRMSPREEIGLDVEINVEFEKLNISNIILNRSITLKEGYIIKSNKFVDCLIPFNEYSFRIIETVLSKLNNKDDYENSNYFNIKDFARDYKIRGGDVYDLIHKQILENGNFKICPSNPSLVSFNMFEYIFSENGVVDYKFSKEFVEMNTDYSQGFIEMDYASLCGVRNWRTKRLYELLLSRQEVGKWRISLENIQKLMGNNYNEYSDFNRHIINKHLKNVEQNFGLVVQNHRLDRGNKAVGFDFNIMQK